MKGVVSAGLCVKGFKDGAEKDSYIYQLADIKDCMKDFGSQAVVAQATFNPVIMMELEAGGMWTGSGVLGPENFPAEPFMERMDRYGFPWAMKELDF